MPKIYFNDIRSAIVDHLNKSENEVHIAVAWFTDEVIFDVLLSLLKRKIKIVVILNKDDKNRYSRLNWSLFVHFGGFVYFFDSEELMHNKFAIIDNKILMNGSYNWTHKASTSNKENLSIFYIADGIEINDFEKEFQHLLLNSVPFFSNSRLQHNTIPYHLHSDQNIVSKATDDTYNKIIQDKTVLERYQIANKVFEENLEMCHTNFNLSSDHFNYKYKEDIRNSLTSKNLVRLIFDINRHILNPPFYNLKGLYLDYIDVNYESLKDLCATLYNKLDINSAKYIKFKSFQCFNSFNVYYYHWTCGKNWLGSTKYKKYKSELDFIISNLFEVYKVTNRHATYINIDNPNFSEVKKINDDANSYISIEHEYYILNPRDSSFVFNENQYKIHY